LIAQLLSTELGRPIATDTDPQTAIALGAALSALPPAVTDPGDVALPEPDLPVSVPMQAPPRPALTAIPLDVEPAELHWRGARTRLVKRVAVAGAFSLLAAAGVVSVPFLTSQSGPLPQAAAGTPAAAPAANPPVPSATSSGAASAAVLTVPVAASTKPASGSAKQAVSPVLRTVGATSPVPVGSSGTNLAAGTSNATPTTQPPVTPPLVTQPPVTQPPVTQPPVAQPPVTQPPVTQPPVAQPPVTQPPVTQPPTKPPATPPTTEPPVTPPTTQPPATPPTTEPPATTSPGNPPANAT
ncbi:MAG: hypothetical protein WCB57_10090, partial [Pseudonocardiaceae bacterium]